MITQRTDDPEKAARWLRAGDCVAFPTETVYGLGANALNADAVAKIFEAKGRPADNPLIVHVASVEQVEQVAQNLSSAAWALLRAFSPGPLTCVVHKRDDVPEVTTAGLDTVGVRIPSLPVAQAFLTACAVPVAAPSANQSGRPSPTTWEAVRYDLDGRIRGILIGPQSPTGIESTVIDTTTRPPVVLRPGAVSVEEARRVVPDLTIADSVEQEKRSPGTRHRHYAPDATVELASAAEAVPGAEAAFLGLNAPTQSGSWGHVVLARDLPDYAARLYAALRQFDAEDLARIVCEPVEPTGLGRALMDRLRRAAGHASGETPSDAAAEADEAP
ncbi:threonylcarbamoyl-AMP synthase [Longimonas halophila]|uniref:Threonylcarbamoyl-AMP synthase n=1 Tax=Longimonas halophila TaxID=1469170 RepID=A0A2H3NM81_9BACT|nr:L-threonylcarbamoyladenylate synthase [Longimonas halophila]PEN07085.1 threonylcarbamoyl-AMP synthase [Longimonas halophila]